MNHLRIVRSLDAPVERVWEVVGNPGVSPGPGVDVVVERPGAHDGSGLIRAVKVAGSVRAHEEILQVGPGHLVRYRTTKGPRSRTIWDPSRSTTYRAEAAGLPGMSNSARLCPERAGWSRG